MAERTCPRCAHDFDSDQPSPACPACGKRPRRLPALPLALAVVALLAASVCFACAVTSRPDAPPSAAPGATDTEAVAREFLENPVAALVKYNERVVTLTGVVAFSSDELDQVKGHETTSDPAVLVLAPNAKVTLRRAGLGTKGVKSGQRVTVRGRFVDFFEIKDAEVVR